MNQKFDAVPESQRSGVGAEVHSAITQGHTVSFPAGNGKVRYIGTVVEVVPAHQLPLTTGLRHVQDKRRDARHSLRVAPSYVIHVEETGRSRRDSLYWPASGVRKVVAT